MTARNNPSIAPVMDSWGNHSSSASWIWVPRSRPDSEAAAALNAWGTEQLSRLLEAVRPLARVRTAFFGGPPEVPPLPEPERTWNERESSHTGFEQLLIRSLRTAPTPVTVVELSFDIDVWVRTEENRPPVRGWVRSAMDGELMLEAESPYGALTINHTLFLGHSLHGVPNTELHRLNAPLITQVITSITEQLGPITEMEGLQGVTLTGIPLLD